MKSLKIKRKLNKKVKKTIKKVIKTIKKSRQNGGGGKLLILNPETIHIKAKDDSKLTGQKTSVGSIAWSPDGQILACAIENDIELYSFDGNTIKLLITLKGHNGKVNSVVFSPNIEDYMLASGSSDKTVKMWNIKTGKCIHTFKGHTDRVNCVVWMEWVVNHSKKYNRIYSGSDDTTIKIWDTDCRNMFFSCEFKITESIENPLPKPEAILSLSLKNVNTDVKKRDTVPLLASSNPLKITNTIENKENKIYVQFIDNEKIIINSLAWHPNLNLLAYGSNDGNIFINNFNFNLKKNSQKEKNIINESTGLGLTSINSVSWSHDGKILAFGGDGNYVILAMLTKNEPNKYEHFYKIEFTTQNSIITSLAWAPMQLENSYRLTGSTTYDGVFIWDFINISSSPNSFNLTTQKAKNETNGYINVLVINEII